MQANEYYQVRARLQYYRGIRAAASRVIVETKRELAAANETIGRLVHNLNTFESANNMLLTKGDDDA